MKALLIKDLISFFKWGKLYIAMILIFAAAFFFAPDNAIMGCYPSLILGMFAITFLQIDEREKWNVYVQTMPCTKKDYVVSKYIVSLLLATMGTVIMAVSSLASSIAHGIFNLEALASYVGMTVLIGVMPCSLMLPLMFKFSAEKGRIMCFVIFGLMFGGVSAFAAIGKINDSSMLVPKISFAFSLVLAIAIWLASLIISIKIYNKREID